MTDHSFFRLIPEHIIYMDMNLMVVEITDVYLHAIGRKRDGVLGKKIHEIFPDIESALQAPQLRDGKFWKVSHHTILDQTQNPVAIFHKSEDVTTSMHLNDILSKMADGFFTMDRNLRITNLNEKFASYFNLPTEALRGQLMDKFSPNIEDRAKFRDMTMEVFRTGIPVIYEESYLDTVLQVHTFRTNIGEVAIIFHDITKVKHQEESLKVSLKMRDLFFSLASHELKTPLTSLQLQTEVARDIVSELKGDADSFRKLNWSFQVINKGVDRLSTLVDNMLDISQISNGKLSLNLEEFCLNTFVIEIMDRHVVQLKAKGIKYQIVHESDVWGKWDPFRIEQVIVNLVSNAMKYGGDSPICITISRSNENAILMFKDEGPGIAKHDHEKVFQQYERIDTNNSNRGMGLGLYICQEIVERHGGEIKLFSELNQGATFTVALPLAL